MAIETSEEVANEKIGATPFNFHYIEKYWELLQKWVS